MWSKECQKSPLRGFLLRLIVTPLGFPAFAFLAFRLYQLAPRTRIEPPGVPFTFQVPGRQNLPASKYRRFIDFTLVFVLDLSGSWELGTLYIPVFCVHFDL